MDVYVPLKTQTNVRERVTDPAPDRVDRRETGPFDADTQTSRCTGCGIAAHSCRIVDDPAAEHIVALRKRMKLSRRNFADSFGLDVRAVQEWEQGRRVPGRAARVLLTVIDRNPEAVIRALGES